MVANKFLLLTILTYVYVSNADILPEPSELTGPEREAAINRLYIALYEIYVDEGPEYRVIKVSKIFNLKSPGYSEDTYDVDLALGRIPKQCVVKMSIDTRTPLRIIKKIKILCNGKLEFQKIY
ncbi:uncharacterized protein LOC132787185 [Drosophila nasuta]|uniref:uncharacterized protein LOC132787185 n=1 Tax=Drosophila nasuta TaxID=42062 RepID=UPI0014721C31|nr:uncharacterized protein LOC132787185 [Drosophila nasuta]